MSLGERILENRKLRGLSQEQLAERLDVSRQAVSKWELDDAVPDVDKVIALAKVYGVTTDELLLGARPAPPEAGKSGSLDRLAALLYTKGYRAGYVLLGYGAAILALLAVAAAVMHTSIPADELPAAAVVLCLGGVIGLAMAAAGAVILVKHRKRRREEQK